MKGSIYLFLNGGIVGNLSGTVSVDEDGDTIIHLDKQDSVIGLMYDKFLDIDHQSNFAYLLKPKRKEIVVETNLKDNEQTIDSNTDKK